jgi:hypothetical protein
MQTVLIWGGNSSMSMLPNATAQSVRQAGANTTELKQSSRPSPTTAVSPSGMSRHALREAPRHNRMQPPA